MLTHFRLFSILSGGLGGGLEVDLEGDFRGDFKQDIEGDLLSSSGKVQVRSGPGLVQVWFSIGSNLILLSLTLK